MGKRRDPEAEQADIQKKVGKIVTVIAARDFTDSEGNEHKAGEPADVTQDELERALIPHGLVTTPEAWASRKKAEEDEANARQLLEDQSAEARGFGEKAEGTEAAGAATSGRKSRAKSTKKK